MQDYMQAKMQMVNSSEENRTRFQEMKEIYGSRDEKIINKHDGWKAIRILQKV